MKVKGQKGRMLRCGGTCAMFTQQNMMRQKVEWSMRKLRRTMKRPGPNYHAFSIYRGNSKMIFSNLGIFLVLSLRTYCFAQCCSFSIGNILKWRCAILFISTGGTAIGLQKTKFL